MGPGLPSQIARGNYVRDISIGVVFELFPETTLILGLPKAASVETWLAGVFVIPILLYSLQKRICNFGDPAVRIIVPSHLPKHIGDSCVTANRISKKVGQNKIVGIDEGGVGDQLHICTNGGSLCNNPPLRIIDV